MEYKFNNLHKILKDKIDPQKTKEILKQCKIATQYQTPEEQYQLGECITQDINEFKLKPVMLAIPLFYAAANKGHVNSQLRMSLYLEYDNHPDSIKYLKMAMAQGSESAFLNFFYNYIKNKNAYLSEHAIVKKILRRYKKSKDGETLSHVAVYYENVEHDYKKALTYYKKTILTREVERLTMFLKYQKNPTKEGREQLAKNYSNEYTIVANKLKHFYIS